MSIFLKDNPFEELLSPRENLSTREKGLSLTDKLQTLTILYACATLYPQTQSESLEPILTPLLQSMFPNEDDFIEQIKTEMKRQILYIHLSLQRAQRNEGTGDYFGELCSYLLGSESNPGTLEQFCLLINDHDAYRNLVQSLSIINVDGSEFITHLQKVCGIAVGVLLGLALLTLIAGVIITAPVFTSNTIAWITLLSVTFSLDLIGTIVFGKIIPSYSPAQFESQQKSLKALCVNEECPDQAQATPLIAKGLLGLSKVRMEDRNRPSQPPLHRSSMFPFINHLHVLRTRGMARPEEIDRMEITLLHPGS